ncbi:RecB family exonuclease [Pseudonocardia sp. RS010]|uniref:RecB family exonuclease n=1 Tax=Pseudonocardia sp. RS010 TaxID=3385979 RepID=UPI0039A146EA
MSEQAGNPATTPVRESAGTEPGGETGGGTGGEERRRPALSPSRAADFKQCPLLYRFRAVDRLPEAPSPAALRGTLVHAVLERLFDLPAAERVQARAKGLVGAVWAEIAAEAPEIVAAVLADLRRAGEDPDLPGPEDPLPGWLASAESLLDTYFALEDPRSVEPQSRELLVETELSSGVPLRGYLDRLDVDGEGGLRIVDYKTGAAPREAAEARALFQMKFYALALLELRGAVPEQLRLVYLGAGGEELTYRPEAGELRRFQRILEAIWAAIREADRTGDFRPRRGPGCGWCAHRGLCPAWDGSPPPYPGWPELRTAHEGATAKPRPGGAVAGAAGVGSRAEAGAAGPAHGDAHGHGASSAA